MDGPRRKVLLVDDNEGDYLLTRQLLSARFGMPCNLEWVDSYEAAIEAIGRHNHDVYLVDYQLGSRSGIDLIREARARECDAPMILLTGRGDKQVDLEAMEAGATDYLEKDSTGELLERSIRYAFEQYRRDQVRARTEEEIALKDRFLSHVSHELRSPVTAIYQFVTLLRDGHAGEITPEQREYLDITTRNIQELRAMIDDLLVAARGDAERLSVRPRAISAAELINDTMESFKMVADAGGVSLAADLKAELPLVHADPDRVRQVLRHLVDNAIRFTPPGGTVTVRARGAAEEPDYVCISVADTGCGLPNDSSQIFDRPHEPRYGVETRRKGLGLGLYFCKQLVTRHGGRIWVASKPGRGSLFSFTLPLASAAPVAAGAGRVARGGS